MQNVAFLVSTAHSVFRGTYLLVVYLMALLVPQLADL
jgi:hypothetical protein